MLPQRVTGEGSFGDSSISGPSGRQEDKVVRHSPRCQRGSSFPARGGVLRAGGEGGAAWQRGCCQRQESERKERLELCGQGERSQRSSFASARHPSPPAALP